MLTDATQVKRLMTDSSKNYFVPDFQTTILTTMKLVVADDLQILTVHLIASKILFFALNFDD